MTLTSLKPELKSAECIDLYFFVNLYLPENSVSTQKKSASLIAFSTSGRTDEKSRKNHTSD